MSHRKTHRACRVTGIRASLLAGALTLLTACGSGQLEPLDADAVIIAFGDSLTSGKGVSQEHAYPAALESLTERRVINAGISGETTSEGLERLPEVLAEHDADLLILLEGGNDILRNQSLSVAKRNLDTMISMARSEELQVVLIGVPEKGLFSTSASLYGELAETHHIPLQSSIISSLLKRPSMKSDSVHFNRAGYRALAEAVFEVLEEDGAL